MIEEKDVRVAVRDRARIGLRVYRPEGEGPFPALFAVSPYRYDNNELPAYPTFLWRETGPIRWYVEQGYAFVHADVRGTGISEGEFRFLDSAEQHDLYDLIEWIAKQPWSNGRVGGYGESYYCMSQWFMGIESPPHLAVWAPTTGSTIRTTSWAIRAASRVTFSRTGSTRASAFRTSTRPTAIIRAS